MAVALMGGQCTGQSLQYPQYTAHYELKKSYFLNSSGKEDTDFRKATEALIPTTLDVTQRMKYSGPTFIHELRFKMADGRAFWGDVAALIHRANKAATYENPD